MKHIFKILFFFTLQSQAAEVVKKPIDWSSSEERQARELEALERALANRWKCICREFVIDEKTKEIALKAGQKSPVGKIISSEPIKETNVVTSCAEAHKVCVDTHQMEMSPEIADPKTKVLCAVECKSGL